MVNINLSTSQDVQIGLREKINNGIVPLIVVLGIVIGGLHFGLIMWKDNLIAKIAVANDSYQVVYTELTGGRNKDIIDFQNRISSAKKMLKQEDKTIEVLKNVEKSMISGVYIEALTEDNNAKTLVLRCIADNYNTVAKQMLSFKRADYFSEVIAGNMKLNKNGKIEFSVNMKIN